MKNILDNLKTKMQGPTGQTRDAIATARNWYSDRSEALEIQRSILIVLLVLCCITIGVLSFDLSYLKSTRSIEPFVIEIEPKTGIATVVTPLDSKVYSEDEIIKKYFVWNYVKLREEYNFALYDYNFNLVELYSASDVFSLYARNNRRGNKNSPIEMYGNNATISLELKSIVFISVAAEGTTAQIRFRSYLNGANNAGATDFIATLTFTFENTKLNEKQRFENPLGFSVTKYILEREYINS